MKFILSKILIVLAVMAILPSCYYEVNTYGYTQAGWSNHVRGYYSYYAFTPGLSYSARVNGFYYTYAYYNNYSNYRYSWNYWLAEQAGIKGKNGKDILNNLAAQKQTSLVKAGYKLADSFALSDEEGIEMAHNIDRFFSLKNAGLNEMNQFSEKIYGLNMVDMMKTFVALKEGNKEEIQKNVQLASERTHYSPESIERMIQFTFQE